MKLLLDTHAFLWFANDDPKLPESTAARISDPETRPLVSLASVWEIGIKISIGKLELALPLRELMEQAESEQGIQLLPIELRHVDAASKLPFHHRDPFDRMLVAQSQVDDLSLLSVDEALDLYGIERIWG